MITKTPLFLQNFYFQRVSEIRYIHDQYVRGGGEYMLSYRFRNLKTGGFKTFFSLVHSDESLHLLATCYYRAGKIGQAYDLLQTNGPRSSQCKFLMAKCCHDLNKYV